MAPRRLAATVATVAAAAAAAAPALPAVRPRRALLYMPGSSEKMMAKGASLRVDSVCLDLEDAVAPQQKQQARANIAKALDALAFQPATEVLVRVNAWDTGLVEEDVRGVLAASKRPHGFVIPKVGSLSELASFHKLLQRSGVGELPVIGMVENAKGVLAVGEIARARELAAVPLEALIFGADDYAASVGATRTQSNEEVWFARNMVLLHARAAGLQCVDIVQIRFKEDELLRKECEEAARMGFTGKQIIHPNQIAITQRAFSPPADKVAWARDLVAAFDAHAERGVGAFNFRGEMIDLPTVLIARQVLSRATEP